MDVAPERLLPCVLRRTAATALAVASVALMGCVTDEPLALQERSVNFGYESTILGPESLNEMAEQLDRVGASGIAVSAGRPEWAAFPWAGHEESVVDAAREKDLLADAIGALGTDRSVTITVDMLAPRTIAKDGELAGSDPDGSQSAEFLSVSEVTTGEYADRAVEFVDTIAERYQPDAVAITELMFDDFTFGEADRQSYLEFSGSSDWPREDDGAIDTADHSLAQWRSVALSGVVARMADAAHAHGVELHMDVRADFDDPEAGRPESGHDYSLLLEHADKLVVWTYIGLGTHRDAAKGFGGVTEMTRELTETFGADRVEISVGLWGANDTVLPFDDLEQALQEARRGGAASVSVTPASLLEPGHWSVLEDVWT